MDFFKKFITIVIGLAIFIGFIALAVYFGRVLWALIIAAGCTGLIYALIGPFIDSIVIGMGNDTNSKKAGNVIKTIIIVICMLIFTSFFYFNLSLT